MPEYIIRRFERRRGLCEIRPRNRYTAGNFWIIQQTADEKLARAISTLMRSFVHSNHRPFYSLTKRDRARVFQFTNIFSISALCI